MKKKSRAYDTSSSSVEAQLKVHTPDHLSHRLQQLVMALQIFSRVSWLVVDSMAQAWHHHRKNNKDSLACLVTWQLKLHQALVNHLGHHITRSLTADNRKDLASMVGEAAAVLETAPIGFADSFRRLWSSAAAANCFTRAR